MNDSMTEHDFQEWKVKYRLILMLEKLGVINDEYYTFRLYHW